MAYKPISLSSLTNDFPAWIYTADAKDPSEYAQIYMQNEAREMQNEANAQEARKQEALRKAAAEENWEDKVARVMVEYADIPGLTGIESYIERKKQRGEAEKEQNYKYFKERLALGDTAGANAMLASGNLPEQMKGMKLDSDMPISSKKVGDRYRIKYADGRIEYQKKEGKEKKEKKVLWGDLATGQGGYLDPSNLEDKRQAAAMGWQPIKDSDLVLFERARKKKTEKPKANEQKEGGGVFGWLTGNRKG
jgi:hypothetical protein